MAKRTRRRIPLVVVLFATGVAGCGGDDRDHRDVERKTKPVTGTFVGEVAKSEALLGIVASPPAEGRDERDVTVFVCDAKRLCHLFSGSAAGDEFAVAAERGDGQATGKLKGRGVTGTIALGGETLRYVASTATAAAGLYDLTISPTGKISGASSNGVGLTGTAPRPGRGRGTLRLADGKRLEFLVTRSAAASSVGLQTGRARLIVLTDHQLKGAGKGRRPGGDAAADFFIRSSAG